MRRLRRWAAGGCGAFVIAQRWTPLMGKLRIQPWHLFFLQSLHALRRLSADIVHSWSFSDSIAASLIRSAVAARREIS